MRDDLRKIFQDKAKAGDGAFAIAWALIDLADAQEATAKAIQRLGLADAATHCGAIESLGMVVKEVAEAINRVAGSIAENVPADE
jgi:hypothetical protein